MRLHYSRTVLVAVVWSILVNGSAAELIENQSSAGRAVGRSNNESDRSPSAGHRQTGSAPNDAAHERSKDASVSSAFVENTQIIMDDVVVEVAPTKSGLSRFTASGSSSDIVKTSTRFSHGPEADGKNSSPATEEDHDDYDHDHHDYDDPGVPPSVAKYPSNSMAPRKNTTILSHGTNESANSSQASGTERTVPKANTTESLHGTRNNHRPISRNFSAAQDQSLEPEKSVARLVASVRAIPEAPSTRQSDRESRPDERDNFPSHSAIYSTPIEHPDGATESTPSSPVDNSNVSFRRRPGSLTSIVNNPDEDGGFPSGDVFHSRSTLEPGDRREAKNRGGQSETVTPPTAAIGRAREKISEADRTGGNTRDANSPDKTLGADESVGKSVVDDDADVTASSSPNRQRGTSYQRGKTNYRATFYTAGSSDQRSKTNHRAIDADPAVSDRKIALPGRPPDFHTFHQRERWKNRTTAAANRDAAQPHDPLVAESSAASSGGEIFAQKMHPSAGASRHSTGTFGGEAAGKNQISVLPATANNYARSLGRISAGFKTIDRPMPEARDRRTRPRENGATLVHGQEGIFIVPEVANLIPPGERVARQRPSSSGKLRAPHGAVISGSVLRLPDENLEDASSTDASDAVRRVSPPGQDTRAQGQQKQRHRSFISGLSGNFPGTPIPSDESSSSMIHVTGDHENLSWHSTSQPRTSSGRGRRRKSVAGERVTTVSSTSFTRTDGVGVGIDGPVYHGGQTTVEVDQPHSELEPPTTTVSGKPDAGTTNNRSVGQIGGGFMTSESASMAVTAEALRSPSWSGSSIIKPTIPEEVRDVESSGAIRRTSGVIATPVEMRKTHPDGITTTGATLKSIETPPGPGATASGTVGELSGENPTTPGAVNPDDPTIVESMDRVVESMASMARGGGGGGGDGEPANLQQLRTVQTSENTGMAAGGARHSNYSGNDNSTRITTTNQWPVKYSAVVEGDLVLGGLMMVHEREDSVTCGPVMPQGGVQALEAMLYTLDWVNKRDLVPGVKIGAHILDDCDKDTYGLEMAVDFIKGSISNIDGAEYNCNKTTVRKVISGVVGAASSVTSIQVANLLRLFRIPQVSFFSTSPELSNKMRFEYFTRTIPSDHYQVKAMVDIVLLMGWSYVSIIYEESNYGEKAYEELEKLLGKHQICIAVKEKLSKDSGVAKAHVYDNIVVKLLTKPRARGCIIFASDQEVAGVMKAVRRCNATGAFSWIGSDGWSARSLVSDGNEPEMEGTLSVQPQANPVEGFEDYFLNLTVENNRRNPWFVEFWEDHFKCRYPNASHTPYNNYTEECTTTEKLTKQNTAFENQLQFVSDAVMAFAYAFRNMHADLCHGVRGLCDAMKPTKGTELLSYLRTVQFKGLSGDVFHFDKNGDGPARYNIIHFKQVSPGKYKWIRVGKYLEGELRLNMSEIQFRLGHPEPPESVCSLPCEIGQAKKYVEGESCCWHCFNCTQYQIRHATDEKQCVLCPKGTVPDEMHSYCREIPENFLRPESGWAIGAMSFSSTGILITLFVGGVFLKHNDTPIVRASGRELSYVLLTGILLCYLVTFALVLRPNDLVCSIQRFSAGFCFTVVYAALLTKTNRISRIFNAGKHSAKRPSFISPRSQLIICSMLVGVQILINGVWMVIDPAKAIHHYPTREDNLLVCNSYIDASYMIVFTYPIILIVVCTVYAVLTRKIPEAFNESKHIGFTMYTTCVIWLAFVPLYFGTGSQVALKITSMSVTISLSASVTIACLFTPKLYIILIHPERNVRPNMMMNRYNTTKGSVVTATNASSMMAPVTLTAVTCDQNKAVKKHIITTTDCSTQSEQYEMEAKDHKNGKLPPAVITRSTQTLLNNNGNESGTVTSPVIKDISGDESLPSVKGIGLTKIGNGPISQSDVAL